MSPESLPIWLAGPAAALAALAVFDAARRASRPGLRREMATWALATALFLLARQLSVTMPGGFSLHYLGTAWLTLLLGYPRAVVSATAVLLLDAFGRGGPWTGLGAEILLFAVAPAWLMWALALGCRRHLPSNLFVFLIGVGFLGLFVAYALPLLAAAALGTLAIALDTGVDAHAGDAHALLPYLRLAVPYSLLLAAGEAWLEGMLTTLLVVYAPGSVRLFDEAHYLH